MMQDDYLSFCQAFSKHTGLDLFSYKRGQMERRIRFMASQTGNEDLMNFWVLLRKDAVALSEFINKLTINVSEFFRNPEKYEELRTTILPELLGRHKPLVIWSAGCSYGAEPYSVRILLDQLSPHRTHTIIATDIDDGILKKAREGRFSENEIAAIPINRRSDYLVKTETGYEIAPNLRRGVEFRKHDLLKDEYPTQVDLILCRNVVIYFADKARNQVHSKFFDSLRPGGYLFIGSSERVSNSDEIGYVQRSPFIYQRPAN